MGKGNRASTQNLPSKKPLVQTRELPPVVVKTKSGAEIRCPFCDDHHVLLAGEESTCGTSVEVRAVQQVISSRLSRVENIHCMKCHKPGGEMVRYRNGFIHTYNCSPDTKLLQDTPKMSILAQLVYKSSPKIREFLERFTGQACQIQEIDSEGNKTGKVIGYSFWRDNAKYSATSTR